MRETANGSCSGGRETGGGCHLSAGAQKASALPNSGPTHVFSHLDHQGSSKSISTLSHRKRAVKPVFFHTGQSNVLPNIDSHVKAMTAVFSVAFQSRCQLVCDPTFLDKQRKPQIKACRQHPSRPSKVLSVNKGSVRGLNLA